MSAPADPAGPCPAPGCGAARTSIWPPFCPRCWRILPTALADAVRGEAVALLSGETPDAFEVACGWLALRHQETAAVTARMTGEREL